MSGSEQSEILQETWRNFCVSDTFEPGSVVKPFTLATGFETGILKEMKYITVTDIFMWAIMISVVM